MSSRDVILAAVRAARPPAVARPDVSMLRGATVDLAANFTAACVVAAAEVVTSVRADLDSLIAAAYAANGRQVSAMSTTSEGVTRPHSFSDTDVFVCEAVIGVAENGAVWLPLSRLRYRAALFLATNVIVVLDRARIVNDMHEAYRVVNVAEEEFGVFVSGPSKTADIEQALVIGAHGAKSLTILLLDE
ncbi:MAG: Lactate utilization protein [Gemmatimonadetes bacterium]|nr:Lactate utilization protein [Gemmatimonadota bacterium]